jgi:plasmid stability protein
MKTTLEFPDELMRALKMKAASEGRRLEDVIAAAIRDGLSHSSSPEVGRSQVRLPLIECSHAAV